MSCLLCFSAKPLSDDELTKGKHAKNLAPYKDNEEKFQISLCETPCKEPGCWCGTMLCCFCSQMVMRKKVLNHVNPNSGWDDYNIRSQCRLLPLGVDASVEFPTRPRRCDATVSYTDVPKRQGSNHGGSDDNDDDNDERRAQTLHAAVVAVAALGILIRDRRGGSARNEIGAGARLAWA
ncbi:unnamed protein product [Pseudo-nitzschia multistriata]|uniref:Uncharacterized protein n=1 Tax=Pseudo-nitzschia multistriata TaxID=183589 RepID=A0A448ZA19_9STRA|nr:unnamed protein product [Pseudo-nitzschia multistriata]